MRRRITIARQMGSGGSYIAQLLAKRLGLKYIDREILALAAQHYGLDELHVEARAEKLSSFWEKNFRGLAFGPIETRYVPPPPVVVSDKQLFETQVEILKTIVEDCDCIVAGYAAAFVLPYHPGVFNVFCHAPLDVRIKRVMTIYNVKDERLARSMIEKADDMRGRYVAAMAGRDWTAATNYHLSIDTTYRPFEETADFIVEMLR
jgi:cytidylate kinase